MSGNNFTVKIEGLKEFQRACREADKALPREIKRALDVIGREILVPMILRRMEENFVLPLGDKSDHKHRSGKLERSVRAVSQQRAGIVKEGVVATPYAGWWEFGGTTHSPRGDTSRPFLHEGRTLYPSLYEANPAIEHEANKALDAIAKLMDSYGVSSETV